MRVNSTFQSNGLRCPRCLGMVSDIGFAAVLNDSQKAQIPLQGWRINPIDAVLVLSCAVQCGAHIYANNGSIARDRGHGNLVVRCWRAS